MHATSLHRYSLDGSNREAKKKINCPECGGKRTFTRYKDYETGEYINDSVGLCDRANKCTYHLTPKEWFALNPDKRAMAIQRRLIERIQPKPQVHIPFDILNRSLKDYEQNSFIKSILGLFPTERIEKAISDYFLGTATSLTGENKSVIFWFIDHKNNIRAGQLKEFDSNCKTLSFTLGDNELKAYWVHRLLKSHYHKQRQNLPIWLTEYLQQDQFLTCLYGEHLLNRYPGKPVALVEAPKTAILASIAYPEFVWLATTSLTYLTKERCKVLKGRNVVLFPDTGIPNKRTGLTCMDHWRERVIEFEGLANFQFSTLLEENTTKEQKEAGFDLADLILDEARKRPIEISVEDILSVPVQTITGKEFDNMIMQTVWMKNGNRYDLLFDKDGEPITEHPQLRALCALFNKTFLIGKISGMKCLINNANN